MGCIVPIKPIPIPPRPPALEWHVGLNFGPWSQAEIDRLSWGPFWRGEPETLGLVSNQAGKLLLIAVTEDDSSVEAMVPWFNVAWGIELGNEANFSHDAVSVSAWYQRMIVWLRDHGYAGKILTAGVGNIDDQTLMWLERSLQNLPLDIVAGVHFYSSWQEQIGKLLAVLNGRSWAMTESGMAQPDAAAEQVAVGYYLSVCQSAYTAGALTCIAYQTHSAPPDQPLNDWGVFRLDGTIRPYESSLISASQWP